MTTVPGGRKQIGRWDYISAVYDGRLAELWFRVAEWILVVAALNAVAVASGSLEVKIIAYVSAGLVIIYALHLGDLAIAKVKADVQGVRLLTRIVVVLIVGAGQYALITAVNTAVKAAFVASGTIP